ncbi:MAG: hypothetical protein KAX19_13090 [Candidatus Brocadiae bacterium]|nr:hypothetical protein [Candidatus Brocadiia bacterium]
MLAAVESCAELPAELRESMAGALRVLVLNACGELAAAVKARLVAALRDVLN